MKFRRNLIVKGGGPLFFVSIFRSRLWQVLYGVPVLKMSRRWGHVGELHGVIYDIKSPVVLLSYSYLFVFNV